MKAAWKNAADRILKAGFSHVKVELEGQIYRQGTWKCDPCKGRGASECAKCEGKGVVIQPQNNLFGVETYINCKDCQGDGTSLCASCKGRGNLGSFTDVNVCNSFMKAFVSEKARKKLVYGKFYRDGSVDSEYTYTMHVNDLELMLEYFYAFKALAKACGKKIDVTGAGMHISVLPKENEGRYPCYWNMPSANLNNFIREMRKLLPALYFLSTASNRTRSFTHRQPQISNGEKYSAIYTHGGTCFEYRVFETCYDRPEAFFDFIQVIANSLKFYADPTKKVSELKTSFSFPDVRNIATYFNTVESLKVLNATIKHLKPTDKPLKELKTERGLYDSVRTLTSKQKRRMAELRNEYSSIRKHWDQVYNRPLSEYEKKEVDDLMISENWSIDQATEYVKKYRQPDIDPEDKFLEKNLTKASRGAYTVAV